jgi:hypothetical protein
MRKEIFTRGVLFAVRVSVFALVVTACGESGESSVATPTRPPNLTTPTTFATIGFRVSG